MILDFSYEINNDPEPEDVGKTIVRVTIICDDNNLTFSSSTSTYDFIMNDEDEECEIKVALNSFFMESGFDENDSFDLIMKLWCFTVDVTNSSDDYSPDSLLYVKMDIKLDPDLLNENFVEDDDHDGIEEVYRISVNGYNDNVESRPANKVVVNDLPRNLYENCEFSAEACSICQEEFEDGQVVVSLPCGHDFHEECIVTWFETSHVCPLCRFKLPF